jgi:hypothetical protein
MNSKDITNLDSWNGDGSCLQKTFSSNLNFLKANITSAVVSWKKKMSWTLSTPKEDKNMYSITDRASKENKTSREILT